MTRETPWQRNEVPGTSCSIVVEKPVVIGRLLKKATRPLFVAAHDIENPCEGGESPVDIIIRIAKATGVPVMVTPSTAASFRKRGFIPVKALSMMEIGSRLNDPGWSVGGKPPGHDLVIFIGFPYMLGWLLQSGLKSFAPGGMRFVSMDRRYQPHCNLSFPNLSETEWFAHLNSVLQEVNQE